MQPPTQEILYSLSSISEIQELLDAQRLELLTIDDLLESSLNYGIEENFKYDFNSSFSSIKSLREITNNSYKTAQGLTTEVRKSTPFK